MSFARAQQWAAARTRGPRRCEAAWWLHVRVFIRRGTLDRLLAAGVDPAWDRELRLRAAQITTEQRRRVLSASLVAAVRNAHEPPRWTAAAPLARDAVRAAADELRALAECLAATATPTAQGVALTEQLLRDSTSPLYSAGSPEALRAAARVAQQALDRPTYAGEETP